ncbi:hypothetical protein ACFE04_006629 [Oxalis oulophora]
MATEEFNRLAPYPQMILSAIEALNECEGSSEASISKYMESVHSDLPASHSALLSQHLTRMRETGALTFSQNAYNKPDQPPVESTVAAPVEKRGRGRPPKPKTEAQLAAAAVVSPPRGRGRPPKNPNAEPAAKKPKTVAEGGSGSGRPRGRPRKYPVSSGGETATAPRGRGRPPKVRANVE